MEEKNIDIIHAEVENMIKDGKGIAECVNRKETQENIILKVKETKI